MDLVYYRIRQSNSPLKLYLSGTVPMLCNGATWSSDPIDAVLIREGDISKLLDILLPLTPCRCFDLERVK